MAWSSPVRSRSPSPTTAPARPTSCRSTTAPCAAMDLRQIKVDDDEFGMMAYDPAFTNTASCRSSITYIDGDAGILEHRGYSIEQLCESSTFLEVAYLLIFGELPTGPQLDRWVFDITHHTFVHEDLKQFFEGFRYDAHPMGMLLAGRRRALDLLPGREADRRPRRALHGGRPADRQGADPGRLLLPPQHGPALRLPGQRPQLRRELPLDDVQEDRSQARAEAGALEGARRALHPPRRPRTELLDQRRARRRLLRRRPLLGGRGRRRGALRARCTAAPTRRCCGCCAGSSRSTTSPTSSSG